MLLDNHYSLITDFNKLMSSYNKSHDRKHFCIRCLHCFKSAHSLEKHLPYCTLNEAVRVDLPPTGSKLQFEKYKNKLQVPFVVYADFECLTTQMTKDKSATEKDGSYTEKYQKHVPCGCCAFVVSRHPDYQPEPFLYRGPDAAEQLIKYLYRVRSTIFKLIKEPEPIIITDQQEQDYQK